MESENNRRRESDCRSIPFGSTVLVVGGTRLERECQMEAPLPVDEFIGEIVEAIRAEQLKTTCPFFPSQRCSDWRARRPPVPS